MSRPDGLRGAELIATALDLLCIAEKKRSETHLRRAVSTAYYAMFHSLARIAADRIHGLELAREADRRAFAAWVLLLSRRS